MARPLIALAVALVIAGCATTTPGTPKNPAAAVSSLPLGCKPDPVSGKCDSFGTYYSGDDLRRTGAQHVGAALNQVDPALTH